MTTIGYLGPQASFSNICALEIGKLIGDAKFRDFPSITQIAEATLAKEIDFGLLPLENSLGGSVPETLEALLKNKNSPEIQIEWVYPVEHYLAGFGKEENLQEIRGHFQAFAQCNDFLKVNFPNATRKEMPSNSAAAASLLELDKDKKAVVAAICPKEAAVLYGLQILKTKINDSPNNFTRFWLVGFENSKLIQNKQQLTSIAFQIPQDEPGGLMKVLNSLAKRNINMTKIESRPTKGRLCEYTFFIDFVNPFDWDKTKNEVIQEIKLACSMFYFLGNYSVWPEGDLRFLSSR